MQESKTQETAKALVMKNKLLFVFCMLFIMLSLFLVCYLFFFRSVSIDVTKNVKITYTGESGDASAVVENENHNMNQRIQEFLDTISCNVTPKGNLSNGTQLLVQCSYSKEIANKYNVNVINEQKEFVVEGLAHRYEQSSDIPTDFFEKLNQSADSYFEKNTENIQNDDFAQFTFINKPTIKDKVRIHRVFLKSVNAQNKDKIIDIYKISASGQVKQTSEGEEVVDKLESIYYTISYDNINSSLKLENDNIFGSQLVTDFDNLETQENLEAALRMEYLLNYSINIIE